MDKEKMIKVLKGCRLKVDDIEMIDSPTVTTCVIKPTPGAKLSSFKNKAIDVAFALGRSVRCNNDGYNVEYEVAKDKTERRPVSLSEMLDCREWESAKSEMGLPVPLGIDTHGRKRYADLARMPHLLVGGATKQGKSEFVRCLISSLSAARSREELQFRLLDNMGCKFREYETEHNVVYGKDCAAELRRVNELMDYRYMEIDKNPDCKFPYTVLIIDEYSDFLFSKEYRHIQDDVLRIAQNGHNVGIHLIIETERVDRNVVSMLLKASIPTAIAFRLSTSQDSRVLVDTDGAERLTGSGDMLFKRGSELIRIQSPTCSCHLT